jgi:hypothetical protein
MPIPDLEHAPNRFRAQRHTAARGASVFRPEAWANDRSTRKIRRSRAEFVIRRARMCNRAHAPDLFVAPRGTDKDVMRMCSNRHRRGRDDMRLHTTAQVRRLPYGEGARAAHANRHATQNS